jgi:hypothetical protein
LVAVAVKDEEERIENIVRTLLVKTLKNRKECDNATPL